MGYVRYTLAPGEKFLYRAQFNWTYDFVTLVWFMVGFAPFFLWLSALNFADFDFSGVSRGFGVAACASLALGALYLLTRFVHKWTTVIAITSSRLVVKHGMISRDTREVSLDKIEEVTLHQSGWDRLFGQGQITVRGVGIALIAFPVLARPGAIRREIEDAVVDAKGILRANGGNGGGRSVAA